LRLLADVAGVFLAAQAGDAASCSCTLHGISFDGWGDRLSTIGLSGWKARDAELVTITGPSGATRLCPLSTMQDPPLDRFHDGRSELAELVRIRDWELA